MTTSFGRFRSSFPGSVRYLLAVLIHASFATTVCATPSASRPVAVPDLFAKGSRYWSVTAGTSSDGALGWIALTELNVSYYIADDLAIEYGGIFGYAEAKRTSGGVLGGPDLGMRWHYAKRERWSLYLEALAGAVLQQHPLTPQTLRFNFDLQPGGGATYYLGNDTLVHGGFRWHHLSNAQVRGRARNFGYDGPMFYFELMRSF